MIADEVYDGYRKVFINQETFVYMRSGNVDLKTMIEAVWNADPIKQILLASLHQVSQRRKKAFSIENHSGIKMFFPHNNFDGVEPCLKSVFRCAQIRSDFVREKQSAVWKIIRLRASKNRIDSRADWKRRQLDYCAEYLDNHFDEFVAVYPDYKYAAAALRNVPPNKRHRRNEDDTS